MTNDEGMTKYERRIHAHAHNGNRVGGQGTEVDQRLVNRRSARFLLPPRIAHDCLPKAWPDNSNRCGFL